MMDPEDACRILLGERLGSIRSIWYEPESPSQQPTARALEIETKTGRFLHAVQAQDGACLIERGPAQPPADTPDRYTRQWTDLTAKTACAFDGRPVVGKAMPLRKGGKVCGLRIEFSNDGQLVYEMHDGEPRLTAG
jgi:hypothetical protein